MKRAAGLAALVAAGALAGAAAAVGPPRIAPPGIHTHPGLPFHSSGSVVGEGMPLKAYASVTPLVDLFGDTLHARLAVVADTKWVDPTRLRVSAGFAPYVPVAEPKLLTLRAGRFEQLTWTWTLRCLRAKCVPLFPPSEKFHVFYFPQAHIRYLQKNGKLDFQLAASWPKVEVLSQISPGVVTALVNAKKYNWQYDLSPVAAPTFRIRPALLFWLAIGAAAAALLGAVALAGRWYLTIRPRRSTVPVFQGTPLERALALLAWAHAHGDETLQRKAFERVGDELGVVAADGGLSDAARELAWSERLPEDEEIQAFAEQAREVEPGAAE